jgi:CRISPR-associated Cas5-like protein
MRTYSVQMEIAGPLAYFGDPASGACFQTYLIPPSSAVEGMFRAIAFLRDGAYIRATRAELCSPLKLVNIVTNYRGPYRKSVLVSQGNSQQMAQVCLQDVCYRLYGEVVPTVPDRVGPAHYLQDLFHRRLGRGQCAYVPHLGLSQFKAAYFGPFREGTRVNPISMKFDSFLMRLYDRPLFGKVVPQFAPAQLVNGELQYATASI